MWITVFYAAPVVNQSGTCWYLLTRSLFVETGCVVTRSQCRLTIIAKDKSYVQNYTWLTNNSYCCIVLYTRHRQLQWFPDSVGDIYICIRTALQSIRSISGILLIGIYNWNKILFFNYNIKLCRCVCLYLFTRMPIHCSIKFFLQ